MQEKYTPNSNSMQQVARSQGSNGEHVWKKKPKILSMFIFNEMEPVTFHLKFIIFAHQNSVQSG